MNLTDLTIAQAAHYIADGDISPVELTRAHLERIEQLDRKLNSFITLTAELALEQAQKAEKTLQLGIDHHPLHGIPLGLKDLYETAGIPTTAGSPFFANNLPLQDSEVVRRLTSVGAVTLGKLNLHELAFGVTNINHFYGACNNPWDMRRITGGSSGGSGAAVMAGLCMGAMGSDTRGSIRIPASLCGVVGIKPTYGRVSVRGVIPLSWTLDHAGPMARTVEDAAIMLQAIAGYDPQDPFSQNVPVDDYRAELGAGVRGWKVALAVDEFFSDIDPEVANAVQKAAHVFEELGAQVTEVNIAHFRAATQHSRILSSCDAASFHQERLENRPDGFSDDVRGRLRESSRYSALDYSQARRAQVVFRHEVDQFFNQYDLLLTPTTPFAAVLQEDQEGVEEARARLSGFVSPFNMAETPALSLPCGFTHDGLPIGLQIVGRRWAEAKVLRAGHAYEQATIWHQKRPVL
jgi:aspartyl-tRNA(Asn)/glutamyl-tRNA(Gln) amidotransferase subunit A